MNAEALTRALGGRWHGAYGMARCPAHDDRRPSLSLKDGEDGRLLCRCHAGCEFPAIMAAVRDRGLYTAPTRRAASDNRAARTSAERTLTDLVRRLWRESGPIAETLAEVYLRQRSIAGAVPPSLRFHWRLRHPAGGCFPAMVGLVEHVEPDVVGLHRTYLDAATATKTPRQPSKAMLGPCRGGAVRLRGGEAGLAVCEGIETALSLASGLDEDFAVWAALSTSGIKGLELPSPTLFGGKLLIGADGDPPGRRAALELADRATSLGWTVEIASAPDGRDFNDLAMEGRDG
jgi:hypothetical protein